LAIITEGSTMEMPRSRSIFDRMRGAALLDVATYEEVEHDEGATVQAAAVVVMYAIAAAIGSYRYGGRGVIGALIGALIGWAIWSGITYLIGTRVMKGTATWGELLRTIGFAQAPGVLLVLGILPFVGWLVRVVVWVWMLIAGVVAIRQALDFDTTKAVITAVLGWVAMMLVMMLLAALGLGGAMAMGG
jgi:hypothetical protein